MSEKDLFISFNQDAGCFAVGSDRGFRIYNVDPFQEMFHRDFSHGGIGIIEMLFRSNILALVGGGLNPRHPTNKVMIWDDHQCRSIGEISFKSEVLAVRLRRDLVVVVVERTIYSYNFRDLKLVDRIETVENKLGLCALSPSSRRQVLACPGKPSSKGQVRVEVDGTPIFIQAHESELAAMSLNTEGTLVATASQRGTLIRVFNTETAACMYELRRGADPAVIHCIAFNFASTFLACSSDKGTVHVWALVDPATGAAPPPPPPTQVQTAPTPTSTDALLGLFSSFKGMLPKYFSSEWSYAQFRIPDSKKTLVAFGPEKTIIVVTVDGRFFRASFDKGGECMEEAREKFYRNGDAEGSNRADGDAYQEADVQ